MWINHYSLILRKTEKKKSWFILWSDISIKKIGFI